ncbi:oligopeptide/dipeptide ABC transporter ATP-binding protein, partial [Enterococcus casseliflavus]|uniref:oligopeptide/dipeptide ABC transporter ATP-binding protein n=1 Tax=Enterococcus casseliflavus TaxID=37734 RepID=UPI003A4C7B37
PKHPYTRSLLNSIPQENSQDSELHVIEGVVPSLKNMPEHICIFVNQESVARMKSHDL